jgi:hypothetical protein
LLVIIGLIVGGVLVGQNLISAAYVRAQITQIEKYNTAVNTFYGKYSALPGDMNPTAAAQFGFVARIASPGEGDGNGIIEGIVSGANAGYGEGYGETVIFWADLSVAGLVDGTFNTASASSNPGTLSGTTLNLYFPQAKIGGGNYVYVWSGGINGGNGVNYFGVAEINQVGAGWEVLGPGGDLPESIPIAQAYAIDAKLDDGFPYTGNVTTIELYGGPRYSAGTTGNGGPVSCSDNPSGVPGAQQYALDISRGSGPNCALSFRFQ